MKSGTGAGALEASCSILSVQLQRKVCAQAFAFLDPSWAASRTADQPDTSFVLDLSHIHAQAWLSVPDASIRCRVQRSQRRRSRSFGALELCLPSKSQSRKGRLCIKLQLLQVLGQKQSSVCCTSFAEGHSRACLTGILGHCMKTLLLPAYCFTGETGY